MKSVRQKWASHKTYRKIQKTWLDYTSIADKRQTSCLSVGDVQTVAQRLDVFLDTFEEAYQEMIPHAEQEQTDVSTEKIYGDCSEIMTTLFNAIERISANIMCNSIVLHNANAREMSLKKADRTKCMQEPMDKALLLISLILKEEKYRRQVSESPDFIFRLLALLEKPGTPETKILFLRIVSTMGESDRNKIEIAKSEGYKKILRLLISDNPGLTQEVVTTVNHLLEFSNDHPDIADLALVAPTFKSSISNPNGSMESPRPASLIFSPKSILSRSSVQLSRPQPEDASLPPRPKSVLMDRHLSRGLSPFDSPRRPASLSSSTKNISSIDRVSQAISEVRGMFVQELGKIFPQLKDQDGLGILGMGSDEPGDPSCEKNFIPNEEQIRFTVAYYSQLMAAPGDIIDEVNSPERADIPDTPPAMPPKPPRNRSDQVLCAETQPSGNRATLKKTASTPDFRMAEKPLSLTRRNSEEKHLSKISWATRGAAVELAQEEEQMRQSQPDNVLKEFMRTQGALKSLMTILSESPSSQQSVNMPKKPSKHSVPAGTRLATKIDIMETVCKVLFQNSANQSEFRAMDGYSTLLKVLDDIVVPTGGTKRVVDTDSLAPTTHDDSKSALTLESHCIQRPSGPHRSETSEDGVTSVAPIVSSNKRCLLLSSLMAVFFDLALDGSARDMVQNTDAFNFLFRLLLESKHLDVRQQALFAIQDLISLNSLNAVAAWRCGNVDSVIGLLRIALSHHSTHASLRQAQWPLGSDLGFTTESPTTRTVEFPRMQYFDHFIVSEDTGAVADIVETGSPVYQYITALTRLLEYIAVILVQDNAVILYELSRLIMEIDFPDETSIVVNTVLRSIGRIVSDMVARGMAVEEKFASIYLQIVRRIVDNRGKTSNSAPDDLDEQEQELRDSVHTEQRLLTLHVLGLVLKGMGNGIEVFNLLQGFDVLASIILLEKRSCHHASNVETPCSYAESLAEQNLCQECFRSDIVVSDLALWIFRDLALQEPDNGSVTTWMTHLLKSTLSGIEELRRQSESTKMSSRSNSGFLHIMPDLQQDQAHALLAYLYTKICGTVSLIFRKNSNSKLAFGEAYGMQILLSILSGAQHQDIATAALIAIGDFFAGFEGTKALLGNQFGYDGFLEIVLDSCRPLDKMSCEIVLEVATVGNVMSVKSRPHVESGKSIYCTEVWPYIGGLSEPHLRFNEATPFNNARKIGERNSFRTREPAPTAYGSECRPNSRLYQTNGRGTPSRPSSVYLDEATEVSLNGLPVSTNVLQMGSSASGTMPGLSSNQTATTNSSRYGIFGIPSWAHSVAPCISISTVHDHSSNLSSTSFKCSDTADAHVADSSRRSSIQHNRSDSSTPAPAALESTESHSHGMNAPVTLKALQPLRRDKGGAVANRKRSNSRNLGGFGLNTTHLGFQSVMPSERMAFKQLAGIVFRDAEAARMTLKLLGRIIACNNPKLAMDYFNLLMLLMEVTPRNKELLGSNNGMRFMLQILFGQGVRSDGLGNSSPGYSYLPKPTDPPYVDLVPAMGAYDISVEDVRMLFDAVYNPLDMFLRLTSGSNSLVRQPLVSDFKDRLGPLPELPAQFDKEPVPGRSTSRPRSESAGAFPSYSGRRLGGNRNSGATSSSLIGSQINPLFISEMEQQMMYAIEKISERVDPPAYFSFNGLNASLTTYPGTVEKVISAKGGYTVSMWVKVTAFLEKETGLLCYEEENGTRTIFELYFKSLDQSNRFCLCVRTQHYPSPPEDYVFDRFDFAETGIWHHIVFVHNKTMKLMVDGCTIQSYGTFNQRRQDKDSIMLGVLGRKGRHAMSGSAKSPSFSESASTHSNLSTAPHDATGHRREPAAITGSQPNSSVNVHSSDQELSLGYFCGQTDSVYFLQGEWDQATAEKVYNLGPASTESWRSQDIKSNVIAVLDPEDFKRDMEKAIEPKERLNSGLKAATLVAAEGNESFSTADDRLYLTHGILQGSCTIHKTLAMRNLIGEVGGIQLCFRFLEMNPSHLQLVGLRVISNLLYKSPENLAQFQTELNGYETMYGLLMSASSELSIEHFGVLFDIAINGMIKDEHLILSNMSCVQLILRLLPSVADSVQGYILRTLVDLIVESPENMHLWRSSFGMTTLFDLLRSLPSHLRPFLMWTLESMVDGITVQELGLLIGFIGHEEPDLFEIRRDIIEMLFKRMTTDHYLVELLGSGLEGVTVLIGLLDSPNEHFRILVLKMIGILLNDNTKSGKAALEKPTIGMTLIRSTLEKCPLSMDVIQVLFGLAQNSYRCDPVFRSDKACPRRSAEKLTQPASAMMSQSGPPVPPKDLLVTPASSIPYHPDANSTTGQSQQRTTRKLSQNNMNLPSNPALPEMVRVGNAPRRTASPAVSITGGAGGFKVTDELTYTGMICLILELVGSLPHTDLVTHTLTDLKRLLTFENMRILWEAGWVNWVGRFILDKTRVRVTSAAENLSYNRAMGVLDGIMQKMMIYDLSRKGSVTVRNKGKLVSRDEDVVVQLRLTEAALAWFDKNPNLDTEAANVTCKGLVILFRQVEELSTKFEEKQRQQEKARQETLEQQRAARFQLRAQEEERERIALEAVSTALNGVLNSMSASDDFETKSVLFKADDGDTDAEELEVERGGDESSLGSDGADTSQARAPLSGSTSPTESSTSTLSLPLSTLSTAMAASDNISNNYVYRHSGQHMRDSFESSTSPRVNLGGKLGLTEDIFTSAGHQQQQQQHPLPRPHQTSRRHHHLQSRSSSSTPPAILDHTSSILMMNLHHDMASGVGLFWPPMGLYEHFANCINNLACYNNSAIRSAMKSAGLFKIRDNLIEKLGNMSEDATSNGASGFGGARYSTFVQHQQWPHQLQPQPQPLHSTVPHHHAHSGQHHHQVQLHHPKPVSVGGAMASLATQRSLTSSSSSPTYNEGDDLGSETEKLIHTASTTNNNHNNIHHTIDDNRRANTLNFTPDMESSGPHSDGFLDQQQQQQQHHQQATSSFQYSRRRQSQMSNKSGLGLSISPF
ncbi:hypothetical protein BG004_006435 [Podila humilis]|nr:hypothetical protein BG004_006435 [Podila humilis]